MKASGLSGSLSVGGRVAARLGPWQGDIGREGVHIQAKLAQVVDEFWMEHAAAFDVALFIGNSEQRWPGVEASVEQGTIRIMGGQRG